MRLEVSAAVVFLLAVLYIALSPTSGKQRGSQGGATLFDAGAGDGDVHGDLTQLPWAWLRLLLMTIFGTLLATFVAMFVEEMVHGMPVDDAACRQSDPDERHGGQTSIALTSDEGAAVALTQSDTEPHRGMVSLDPALVAPDADPRGTTLDSRTYIDSKQTISMQHVAEADAPGLVQKEGADDAPRTSQAAQSVHAAPHEASTDTCRAAPKDTGVHANELNPGVNQAEAEHGLEVHKQRLPLSRPTFADTQSPAIPRARGPDHESVDDAACKTNHGINGASRVPVTGFTKPSEALQQANGPRSRPYLPLEPIHHHMRNPTPHSPIWPAPGPPPMAPPAPSSPAYPPPYGYMVNAGPYAPMALPPFAPGPVAHYGPAPGVCPSPFSPPHMMPPQGFAEYGSNHLQPPPQAPPRQRRPVMPGEPPLDPCRLYIGNIAFHCQHEQLATHMAQAGPLEFLDMLKGNDHKFIGCARVRYLHADGARRAIETLSSQPLLGRPLIVRYDREPLTFTTGKLGKRWMMEDMCRRVPQVMSMSPPPPPTPMAFSLPPPTTTTMTTTTLNTHTFNRQPPPPGLSPLHFTPSPPLVERVPVHNTLPPPGLQPLSADRDGDTGLLLSSNSASVRAVDKDDWHQQTTALWESADDSMGLSYQQQQQPTTSFSSSSIWGPY